MLHCIMMMTMTGEEGEEGDECARSIGEEYTGTVGKLERERVFPLSVAITCIKVLSINR